MTDMSGPIKWHRPLARFRFNIRTQRGLQVERLVIHGRDRADAERKLRQMYQACEIVDCVELKDLPRVPGQSWPPRRTLR
jgi:hypothetical protein